MKRFFIILLILGVLAAMAYFGYKWYEKYQVKQMEKKRNELRPECVAELTKELEEKAAEIDPTGILAVADKPSEAMVEKCLDEKLGVTTNE